MEPNKPAPEGEPECVSRLRVCRDAASSLSDIRELSSLLAHIDTLTARAESAEISLDISRAQTKDAFERIAKTHNECVTLREEKESLTVRVRELTAIVEQVDDVLIVNWIVAKNGDYRKALTDLITWEIQIHDDPAVSSVAAERKAEVERLTAENAELRQDKERLDWLDRQLSEVPKFEWRMQRLDSGGGVPMPVRQGWLDHDEHYGTVREAIDAAIAQTAQPEQHTGGKE